MKIGVISIASDTHDPNTINRASDLIIAELKNSFDIKEIEINDIHSVEFPIVLIKTGGTEHKLKKMAPSLVVSGKPITLLATGSNNSLPASLEIIYWLNRNGFKNNLLLHGPIDSLKQKITKRAEDIQLLDKLNNTRIGVIGKPSDWLIASDIDYKEVSKRWGVTFIDIHLDEMIENTAKISETEISDAFPLFPPAKFRKGMDTKDILEAVKIYLTLKKVIQAYRLNCLTLRCFDLLTSLKTTGCLALARLNDAGVIAGCEGDVPALFTMLINRFITGSPSFMGNPCRIMGNKLTLAHCTVPLSMVESFGYKTHFESGKGVAIAGKFLEGPVTITKIGGNFLDRFYVTEGKIVRCDEADDLCRTQLSIEIEHGIDYFFSNPIGNHHVISIGRNAKRFEEIMELFDAVNIRKLIADSVMV